MAIYRIPILVWQDWEGVFTAAAVDIESQHVGTAVSAAGAVRQMKGYMQWLYRRNPWMAGPDFLEPKLVYQRVTVRPEYTAAGRVYPAEEPLEIKVACVIGKRAGGMQSCAVPMFGLRVDYYENDAWQGLVAERVRKLLSGLTPRELARFLPPQAVFLEEVSVRQTTKPARQDPLMRFTSLAAVAEALGHPSVRKRYVKAWQREDELAELVARLSGKSTPVLLVGESGSGKTTLLASAVRAVERQKIKTEEQPEVLHPYRYWLTSAARLIAGMKYLGQWEERCEGVIWELAQMNGVLCAANLLDLVRHGGAPESSIAAFLLPYLQSGELRMVAEATPTELDACRRLLPGLADVFQPLPLKQLSRGEARAALGQVAAAAGQEGRIAVEPPALDAVCRLFSRFMPYQALPGRAAPFVGKLVETARRSGQTLVTAEHALDRFVKQTGLPEQFLRDDYPLPPAEIEAYFKGRIFGQDAACRAATRLVASFKAGLNDPRRPAGVFLFCGPTGVGKTELARLLSQYFFGHGEKGERLVRLDMSEYSGWGAAQRLIAQPDGAPSEFISQMRRQPFAVILLDEIEKAQSDVFDMLLGLFDEGRLSDTYGRVTNFCTSIVIMTSNLGAARRNSIGYGDRAAGIYESEVRSFFRPEFFNRIDEVVTFDPLDSATCLAITRKELADLAKREGLHKNRLILSATDRLIELLTREGFDPRYGARPLQRTLETRVVARLAHYLVEHPELQDCTLVADAVEGEVQIAAPTN